MNDLNDLDIAIIDLEGIRSMLNNGYSWSQIWNAVKRITELRSDLAIELAEYLHQQDPRDRAVLATFGYTFGPKGMCTGWSKP